MSKSAIMRNRKDTWTTFWLATVGVLVFLVTVYLNDFYGAIKRGEKAQGTIQMLDQMRRPFLMLKQVELQLLEAPDDPSIIPDIERAIHDGRHNLKEYLELATYNEEVLAKVLPLEPSYEKWVALELELVRQRAFIGADLGVWEEHGQLDSLVQQNAAAFLEVMAVLGEGEVPIHHDINNGAAAIRGLLLSTLTLIAYLIGLAFWWERKRHQRELRLDRMAYRDSLTGLANRSLLDDRLAVAIAEARRYGYHLGILYIDLDGFKLVNDELGHDAGDTVLKEVASRLESHAREMDTVARVGGDEFVMLITKMKTRDDAQVVADKLQSSLKEPFQLNGHLCSMNASIGIAIYPDDGEAASYLLKHADAAMYEIKQVNKAKNGESLRCSFSR